VLYHYESKAAGDQLESFGVVVARPGRLYCFETAGDTPASGSDRRAA